MVAFVIEQLLITLLLGGGVVCGEARGQDFDEQTAVAAVIAERGGNPIRTMTAPYQFAKPCRPGVLKARHVVAFAAGYFDIYRPEWWSSGTIGFDNVRRNGQRCGRLAKKWRRRGWRQVRAPGMAHRYWRRRVR